MEGRDDMLRNMVAKGGKGAGKGDCSRHVREGGGKGKEQRKAGSGHTACEVVGDKLVQLSWAVGV